MGKNYRRYDLPPSLPVLNKKITPDREYIAIKEENDKLKFTYNFREWETLCEIIYRASHCKICSNRKAKYEECTGHISEYEKLNKTIAIGTYFPIRKNRQNKLSELIRALKDKPKPIYLLASALTFVLEKELAEKGPEDIDFFTYVPELRKDYKDGNGIKFNQSRLLIRCLTYYIARPILKLFVKKSSFSFKDKNRKERRNLARKGYDLSSQQNCKKVTGKNIAIVDDLRTTGATGNRFATLLKEECKAKKVFLLVAGRTYWV